MFKEKKINSICTQNDCLRMRFVLEFIIVFHSAEQVLDSVTDEKLSTLMHSKAVT